jgi:hypothetical protein
VVASGNLGSARYGTALASTPTFLVSGTSGPLAGVSVNFTVQDVAGVGSGTVSGSTAVTNAQGIASPGTWTMSPAPGENRLRATAGNASVEAQAFATSGPPTTVVVEAGNNQNWVERSAVPVRPAVKVTDGTFGVPAVQVTFAVTGGNGTVGIPQVPTNAAGVAAVGSWRLGDVGANTLSATVNGIATPVTFTATAAALVVTALNRVEGDAQAGYASNYAGARPVVEVRNQFDQPAEGVPVTFAVTSGGGTLVRATDTTRTNGRATLGSWRFGPAGAQSVSATASAATTTFTANATAAPASQFAIEVRYLGTPPNATIQAAFAAAASRWSQVIVGDLPNSTQNLPLVNVDFGGQVGITPCSPALSGAAAQIDDMVIFADIRPIDGVGQVLGGATDAISRTDGTTITGCMIFDLDDLGDLETLGILGDVILHEMGHVIGIGSKWAQKGLLVGNCPVGSIRPYFTGSSARQAFLGSLISSFTDSIVPVEGSVGGLGLAPSPCPPDGTRDSHWGEFPLTNELMTGFVDVPGPNPLSAFTAASVRDIGYLVNDAASDAFSLLRVPALRAPGQSKELREVNLIGRRYTVDALGNIVDIR